MVMTSPKTCLDSSGLLNRRSKRSTVESALSVDYGATSLAAGPWSTAMSSGYADSKCLPCVDDILTPLCLTSV